MAVNFIRLFTFVLIKIHIDVGGFRRFVHGRILNFGFSHIHNYILVMYFGIYGIDFLFVI